MRNPLHSLYAHLAALFMVLLLAFTGLGVYLASHQLGGFLEEVEQRLNRSLASTIAKELTPLVRQGIEQASARNAVERVIGIHPGIDIYVLTGDGRVAASFTGKPAAREQIAMAPIRSFLLPNPMLPLHAEDPGSEDAAKIFSAAPLKFAGESGFVFVILRGMPVEEMSSVLRTSYILKGMRDVMFAVLLATVAAGLLALGLLTRRLRQLTGSVHQIREGDLSHRSRIASRDEIGQLASAFNELASTVERQMAELKLTDETRRALARNVSHDFRTPLTSIRLQTERLLHAWDRLTVEQRRDALESAHRSTRELEHLAGQLESIVKLDDPMPADALREPFSLADLAQDAVAKFAPIAEALNVHLRISRPPVLPMVCGAIDLVERAISNIIDNALRHTRSGGAVQVDVSDGSDQVNVIVRDQGQGIPQDELPFVGQRFYRTRRSHEARLPGTGLGLAIAREIAQRHSGGLAIHSETDDAREWRTEVTFTLPAHPSGP